MKCPKCHASNPDNLKFCGECGTRLPPLENVEITATMETPKEELTTGSTFAGRYQIIEELGKGGMGRVYKVLDKEVNAKVALKLIKPEIAADKKTIERFRNELKIARDIAHKNVCRMYHLGKEEGAYYITMEYVSGEDLKSFIRRSGVISVGKAISIANQVCEGLLEAHRLGVIHRDLKPQNIMIDKEGNARIMDFGIARSLRAKGITGSGVMIGTPEYMSPEQVDGKEADQRADIYSLGVILYEMVTGRVPFEGDTPFSIGIKQKSEAPRPPKEINEQIPEDLNRVILKCMEKEREKRYQSVGELQSELMGLEKGIPTTARIIPERKPLTSREITVQLSPKKLLIPALVIIAIAVIGLILWSPWTRKDVVSISSDKPSIAVMYFKNNTGDEKFDQWRTSLPESIITDLSQSKFVRVLSVDQLLSIYKRLDLLKAESYTSEDLKAVASEGKATHILQGSLNKAGNIFRIQYTLKDMKKEEIVGSDRLEGEGDASIFSMVDALTIKIKQDLNFSEEQISSDSDKEIGIITTSSPEAYKYYSEGRLLLKDKLDLKKCVSLFQRAVSIDQGFAMAYRALANCFLDLGDEINAKENLKKAFELKDRLTESESYLITADFYRINEEDFDNAIKFYNKVLEIQPDNWVANNNMAIIYINLEEYEKALELYETNRRSGDDHVQTYFQSARMDKRLGRYQKAIETLDDYLSKFSDHVVIHVDLAQIYSIIGQYELAFIEADKAIALDPMRISKGPIYHLQGDYEAAEKEYTRLLEIDNTEWKFSGREWLEILYRNLGQYEKAREQAGKGLELAEELKNKIWKQWFHMVLGFNYLSAGDYKETMREAEILRTGVVDNQLFMMRALFLKAMIYIEQNQIDEALTAAEEMKKITEGMTNPKLIRDYYFLLGMIEFKNKNYSKAIDYVERCYSLYPKQSAWQEPHAYYGYHLGLAYFQSGNLDKAEKVFDDVINMTTGRLWWGNLWAKSFYMLGKIHEEQGDTAKAIENYEKFLSLWKDADPGIAEVEDAKKRLAGLKKIDNK